MRLRVRPVRRLAGRVTVPGDKSISHRAALLGALADGVTEVRGFLEAEDCVRTLAAIEALGVEVTRKGPGEYRIAGAGPRGFSEPADVLDCGNSGTTARLLLGVLAAQPFWTFLTGDESLRRRPMARVVAPLAAMGATVVGRADAGRLPLGIRGGPLRALHWDLPVASAQVKSAILLAGLHADGPVSVTEPAASRDHSERLLRRFGARVERRGLTTTIEPGRLVATSVRVPGDISSAAFLLVAGAIVADSRVTVSGVGLNPTRTGVLEVLEAMGARLSITPAGDADADEPAGDVTVTAGELRGTRIAGSLIPRLIDEIPALAVAAACARGRTDVRDAAELRVKESDRVAVLARELGRLGARVAEQPDGLVVEGGGPLVGARVSSDGDHRIAMALAVAALVARGTTVIEDAGCIATSFPQFPECLNRLAGEPVAVLEP
ncbi:MAG TPA: 3-phosphoshikimate 1-carboxyvinyltransferase [Candidatus Binatia bacterium]|nr:3-phosphoshikimate 1-carboxyvinyltransferase [Candidatus Binatia bacterium]